MIFREVTLEFYFREQKKRTLGYLSIHLLQTIVVGIFTIYKMMDLIWMCVQSLLQELRLYRGYRGCSA